MNKKDRSNQKVVISGGIKQKVFLFVLFFAFAILIPVSISSDLSSAGISHANAGFLDFLSQSSDLMSGQFDGVPEMANETYSDGPGFFKGLIFKLAELVIRSLIFVVYAFLWLIYSIFYSLVQASEWILAIIFDPAFVKSMGGFTQVEFVKKTASLVSNICNIAYLFVLLYIAILAMLGRADTGRWLKKLVIAALLTNFSLVIAGAVIDASQILMYSFPVGKSTDFTDSENNTQSQTSFDIGTNIMNNLQKNILGVGSGEEKNNGNFITDQLKSLPNALPSEDSSSFWTVAGAIFLFKISLGEALSKVLHLTELIVFCVAMMITLVTITSILVVRIVALWLILIISPAAFLLYSFPPTERYFSLWFDSLVKYAFTGPILIFFLFVAEKISQFMSSSGNGNRLVDYLKSRPKPTDTSSLKDDFVVFIANNFLVVFQFIVIIITIWAGIIIANKFGIKGSASADQLINRTRKWSKKALMAVGGGVVASKMATWSGFDLANKLRGNKLAQINASLGENQAQLAGMDPESAEYKDLSEKVENQKTTKETLESKMKKSAERKNRVMKAFALTSPSLLKKRFSKYMEDRNKKYHSDVDTNLSDFTNYWLNRGKSVKLQTANAERQAHELQNEIDEQLKKLATAKDDKEAGDIKEKIKHYVNSLLKLSVKDEERRKRLLPQIMQELEDRVKNPKAIKDLLDNDKLKKSDKIDDQDRLNIENIFGSIDTAIKNKDSKEYKKQLSNLSQEINKIKAKDPSLANESFILEAQKKIAEAYRAKFLPTDKGPSIRDRFASDIPAIARENAINFLAGSKIKEENAKKIKEKMEEFKKDPMLNKELLARKFARDELDPIEREAVVGFFSSSARDMSSLVRSINKENGKPDGDITNAMTFITNKTSEMTAMRAFNNVQADAEKSKNLTLIGHTVFDSTSGSYRSTSKEERSQGLNRSLNSMSDKSKLSKLNPAVFQYDSKNNVFVDPLAVKAVVNSIDFKKITKDSRLASEVVEDIASNTKKSLVENSPHFSDFINNSEQQNAFKSFVKSNLE